MTRRRYRYHYRPARRRRPRRYSGRTDPRLIAGMAAVVLLAGAGAGAHAATPHHAVHSHTSAATPSGSSYTPTSWARALLGAGGWPTTSCDLNALVSWENAEGGNWNNSAQYNPLDTTQPEPGSWSINSVHVQGYPSWREGFTATITTLNNGFYGAILAALAAANNAQAVADAVAASPWGTGPFTASC